MTLVKAKKETDIALSGIQVEFEKRDGSLFAVVLRDLEGHLLKISQGNYSSIEALVPEPPKSVKKFRLFGKFAGIFDVQEDFDERYEANDRLREFERKFSGPSEDIGLEITEVEVLEAA